LVLAMIPRLPTPSLFPYTTLFRSEKSGKESKKSNAIIKTAMNYNGTPYRYGGTTKKGMDCSGLIYVSFKEHGIPLQRVSAQMAKDRKSTRLNSSHVKISYAVFCLK